jgi:hypothetical protein
MPAIPINPGTPAIRMLTNHTETTYTASSFPESEASQVSVLDWTLNIIREIEKKSTLPVNAYKEIVRFLLSRFNGLYYLNHEQEAVEVKCRYGNPERTIAKLNSEDNIVLPLITISQDVIVEAPTRRRNASNLIQSSYWDDEKQKAVRVVSLCDVPVTIQYNINVWAKYMEDLDQLSQKIRLSFNPSITLNTNFSKNSQVFLEAETNNYSFSLADREDRVLRKSFTASVETYIKSPKYLITSTGKIEKLNIEADVY